MTKDIMDAVDTNDTAALIRRHNEIARLLRPPDCQTILDAPMTDAERRLDWSRCGECGLPFYRHYCQWISK